MSNPNPLSLGLAAILLMGGVAGGVVGSLIFTSATGASRSNEAGLRGDGDMPALAAAIKQLTEEVRALSQRTSPTAHGAPVTNPSRENASTSPPTTVSIDRVAAALDRLSSAWSAGSGSPGRTVPLQIPAAFMTDAKRAEIYNSFKDSDTDDLSRDHHFMTYQQVMDRYGRPDRMRMNSGSLVWEYEFPSRDKCERTFSFMFVDGFLIKID